MKRKEAGEALGVLLLLSAVGTFLLNEQLTPDPVRQVAAGSFAGVANTGTPDSDTPTPSKTPTVTSTPTPSRTPTSSPTATSSPTVTPSPTPTRTSPPPERKVYVQVILDKVHLNFTADRGTSYGEIWLHTVTRWPTGDVEHPDPQIQSRYEISWADGETRNLMWPIYYNEADCPVTLHLLHNLYLREDDNSLSVTSIISLTETALSAYLKDKGFGALPAGTLAGLLSDVLPAPFEELGSYAGRIPPQGSFPDPCISETPVEATYRLNISNTLPQQEGGDPIGWADVRVLAARKEEYSVKKVRGANSTLAGPQVDEAAPYLTLALADLGQPNEGVIIGTLRLAERIPLTLTLEPGDSIRYQFALDVDDQLATGAPMPPWHGADYLLELQLTDLAAPVARLLQWNAGLNTFVEIPAGLYAWDIGLENDLIHLAVELQTLGNPIGPVSGWGLVTWTIGGVSGSDSLPVDSTQEVLRLPVSYAYSGITPRIVDTDPVSGTVDVPVNSAVIIDFNKAMSRTTVDAAFVSQPPLTGTFSWIGDRTVFQPGAPLQADRLYTLTVTAAATDRAGHQLDGNFDGVSGDAYSWSFRTQALPLFTADVNGIEQHLFPGGSAIYARGADFAAQQSLDLYITRHDRILTDTAALIDVRGAPTVVTTTSNGAVPLAFMWTAPVTADFDNEGEFHLVADVNNNGRFDEHVDRRDQVKPGIIVPAPAVYLPLILRGF